MTLESNSGLVDATAGFGSLDPSFVEPSTVGASKPGAMFPLGSTATKFVRTLLIGRDVSSAILPAGDRPRDGGDVLVSCWFCSNLARKEAKPLGEGDMTVERANQLGSCTELMSREKA